ncbi:hypothetical protein BCR42DRAFT_446125 [Absidia repens]|uniref:Uncharacterized protein n=1 Tax=Absidia repens TaxID=90262 RepID=A0A1X2IXW8_9FUNG|nr:hypothetical protein BCR42DRAFT_446125 [Absidia repens]
MKLNKLSLLSTITIFMVVFFVQPSLADLPPKTHEAADWTKDKVNAFLSKYNLGYDKRVDEARLAKKIQGYEMSAKNNAQYFGAKVDRFINSIKIRLEQQHNLSKQDLDSFINIIQNSLRQLELKGQLTGDRVGQAIDKVQRQMAHKKSITEGLWESIKNEVGSQFIGAHHYPSLLQRVFSASSSSLKSTTSDTKSSVDQWLEHVHENLLELKVLNERQMQSVLDQLRYAITKKNIHKLASAKWYNHLYHRLQRKGKLTEKQMDQIRETLEHEVNAYKVFAADYIGNKMEQSEQWVDDIYDHCCHTAEIIKASLEDWGSYLMARFYDLINQQQQIKNKARDDIKEAKTSVVNSVIKTEQDWKHSFDRYWRNTHLEAYRQLGYSEAQLDHLKTSFTSAFTNKQSLAQKNVDRVLKSLKQYMQNAQVQTSSQIQAEMDRIRRQLDYWKSRL